MKLDYFPQIYFHVHILLHLLFECSVFQKLAKEKCGIDFFLFYRLVDSNAGHF